MSTLKELISQNKISVYKLSKDTGIAYSTLCDLVGEITPMENTSAGTLLRLAQYFNVSMESLLTSGCDEVINIYNEGRNVHVVSGSWHIQYLGPKNLVSFKKISCVRSDTVYIDTYFTDENGMIYLEEDYIDLYDLFKEHNYDLTIDSNTKVSLGFPGEDSIMRIIDNSIMVSDSMAISLKDFSTDDVVLEIINLKRKNNCMNLRLRDYAVLSTNMSPNMQKRAINTVKRNHEIIIAEISTEDYANA